MGVTVRGLRKGRNNILKIVGQTVKEQMNFAMKDLDRVASETSPLDEGDLEKGGTHGVFKNGKKTVGWVRYVATSNTSKKWPNFNYAIWTHQEHYNLGKRSKQKGGGTGLSGKKYKVGRQYLVRPFKGEAPEYRKRIEAKVKSNLRKG